MVPSGIDRNSDRRSENPIRCLSERLLDSDFGPQFQNSISYGDEAIQLNNRHGRLKTSFMGGFCKLGDLLRRQIFQGDTGHRPNQKSLTCFSGISKPADAQTASIARGQPAQPTNRATQRA